MFVQCCVDAGVSPFDLFPHVADEVSTRSASKSRHGHESMHSRASIDSLLKSQCRPTVLSIGPEMLANPASRKQVRSKVTDSQYVGLCLCRIQSHVAKRSGSEHSHRPMPPPGQSVSALSEEFERLDSRAGGVRDIAGV
jgi:hypothetical protein